MIHRSALCLLMLLSTSNTAPRAQEREGSAVISGKVTVDGKPASGVLLVLSRVRINQHPDDRMMQGSDVTKTASDSRGHYQFSKLAEGTYEVNPFSPSTTSEGKLKPLGSIVLAEGEEVDGIDFDLKSGAVITGTVTSADARPVIGLNISAGPDDRSGDQTKNTASFGSARTDDRGVYRIFGLAPGRYRVETTIGGPAFVNSSSAPTSGSYHDHDDPSKPGVVVLAAGSEATGIDIRLAPPESTFEATGRVVDESGRAIPNVNVLCDGEGRHVTLFGGDSLAPQTNTMGEFKIRGLKSGNYTVAPFGLFATENEYYGEPVKFEVKGANVTGLEIKVQKGMIVSGQVVVDGSDDPQTLARLYEQQIMGGTEGTKDAFSISKSPIGPGGEFALHGLAPGKLHLAFGDFMEQSPFQISRVELNGIPQKEGIPVTAGQDLTGLKVVVLYSNCSIHGRVTVTGGKLPKGTSLLVSVTIVNPDSSGTGDFVDTRRRSGSGTTYADPGGNYKIAGLSPGEYQVMVQTLGPEKSDGSTSKGRFTQQTITLVSGQDAALDMTIDLAAAAPSDK
jgi:protocatechuate 3,4-dioxygenase beta subunit